MLGQIDAHDAAVLPGLHPACPVARLVARAVEAEGRGRAAVLDGAFEAQAVFVVVAVLEPQLAVFLRGLPPVCQPILADNLCGPVAALPIGPQRLGNAGQEDAHGREPLLTVDDTDGLHHAGRSRLRECEERAAVVRCLGAGTCDRQKVLDQPFDVGLTPAVAALPARHDVLDLPVQEIEEVDVLSVHGFTFF